MASYGPHRSAPAVETDRVACCLTVTVMCVSTMHFSIKGIVFSYEPSRLGGYPHDFEKHGASDCPFLFFTPARVCECLISHSINWKNHAVSHGAAIEERHAVQLVLQPFNSAACKGISDITSSPSLARH